MDLFHFIFNITVLVLATTVDKSVVVFLRHFASFCKFIFFILECNFLINQNCLRGGGRVTGEG